MRGYHNIKDVGKILQEGKIMSIAKMEAKRIIEKLPDEATWDDIMYEFYIKKKIETGLKAAGEGRVISHKDVKKRLQKNEN